MRDYIHSDIFGAFGGDFYGSLGIPHLVPCSKSRGPPPDRIRLPSCCAVCWSLLVIFEHLVVVARKHKRVPFVSAM